MKEPYRIIVQETRPIEFLFASDLETELHPGEDPDLGVPTRAVLEEILKEARCRRPYTGLRPPDFILSNGDEDSRFDSEYEGIWKELEKFSCYHVFGNHESVTFGTREGNTLKFHSQDDGWRDFFGYEETYYAWEYSFPETTVTFVALDTWCLGKDERGGRICMDGSGNQLLRDEEGEWLKETLDRASGIVVVFAHAHCWPPGNHPQDNDAMEILVDILKGTYAKGALHKHAHVFFNGGHHDHPDCNKEGGVYFVDPIGAIHGGYARVVIDPVGMKMDYIGRFKEKSYEHLDLT